MSNLSQFKSLFGFGGATSDTGNVVLTKAMSGQAAARKLTPTTWGKYVQLPDATLLNAGIGKFSLWNAGEFPMAVRNSAGVTKGFIDPGDVVLVDLCSNATAAGEWALAEAVKIATRAEYHSAALTPGSSTTPVIQAIALDATRTALLYGYTQAYVQVYDHSTQTWGTPVSVRASLGNGAFIGVKSATDQLLVVSNSATTAMEAVTVNFTGTAATVNTANKATATLAAAWAEYGQLIAHGAGFALIYGDTSSISLRAITVAGNTPTIGAAVVVIGGSWVRSWHGYVGSATVLLVLGMDSSGANIYAKPYSLSGSTYTLGTQVTSAVASGYTYIRSLVLGTRWVMIYNNNSADLRAVVVSLAGTVATWSGTGAAAITGNINPASQCDAVAVGANKVAVSGINSTARFNIITDTAGVASVGTEQVIAGTGVGTLPAVVGVSDTDARFAAKAAASLARVFTMDCSGASAVVTTANMQLSADIKFPSLTNPNGCGRSFRDLVAGAEKIAIPDLANSSRTAAIGAGAQRILESSGFIPVGSSGCISANAYESWLMGPTTDGHVSIQLVEAAQ